MKNLSYKQYKCFCQAAYLEPNQNLYQHLNQEWRILQQRLEALKTINVTNIEPLTRISPQLILMI